MLIHIKKLLNHFWSNPHILLLIATFMWASHAIALKISIGEVSPIFLMWLRWIGCLILLLLIFCLNVKSYIPLVRANLTWTCLMGGVGLAGFTTGLVIAAQHTSAINLGIIQSFIPAIVITISAVSIKNPITVKLAISLFLSVIGALILVGKGSLLAIINMRFNNGDIIMLLGCICYAGYTIGLIKQIEIPPLVLLTFFSFFASVTTTLFLIIEYAQGNIRWPSNMGWIIILYCILFPSIVSQTFFMRGVELIGANRAGLYVNLVPVFTALIAITFLVEDLYLFHIISLIFVLSGIYLSKNFK